MPFSSETTERTLILDGGFGTTLEEKFHKNISNTPLWSAGPINDDPESIIQTHLAFLRAGAEIILTSTYQCSFEAFSRAGYTLSEAESTMLKSVSLAHEARARFVSESQIDRRGRDIKIALSLGPFGASLSPPQDFGGIYPPPYGPKAMSTSSPDNGQNMNSYPSNEEGRTLEEGSIKALTSFHLSRLLIFFNHGEQTLLWGSKIDFIAFETIPALPEIKAIRRAMYSLYNNENLQVPMLEMKRKSWWITASFPNGRYPQNGTSIRDVIKALLEDVEGEVSPDGIGINCTQLDVIPDILDQMELEVAGLGVKRPWLVLYPNGGDMYLDLETGKWKTDRNSEMKGDAWAHGVARIIKRGRHSKWAGVIVGGCCSTGPEEIEALSNVIG